MANISTLFFYLKFEPEVSETQSYTEELAVASVAESRKVKSQTKTALKTPKQRYLSQKNKI